MPRRHTPRSARAKLCVDRGALKFHPNCARRPGTTRTFGVARVEPADVVYLRIGRSDFDGQRSIFSERCAERAEQGERKDSIHTILHFQRFIWKSIRCMVVTKCAVPFCNPSKWETPCRARLL